MSLALPSDARGFQGQRAGIVSRTIAGMIDLGVVVIAVVAVVIGKSVWTFFFSTGERLDVDWPSRLATAQIGGLVLFLYLAWGWARTGKTIGKRVLGLSVVTRSGSRLPVAVAIARAILCVAFPVGLGWALFSAKRASVQDLLLRTSVVYDWRGARGHRGVVAGRPAAATAGRDGQGTATSPA